MKNIAFSLLLFIGACAQIPFGTHMALNNLDPMTADVTAIRFAVDQAVNLPLDTMAKLHISITTPEQDMGGTFVLDRVSEPLADAGQVRTTFAIAEIDHHRFITLREQVLMLGAKYPDDSEGTLSIAASGCMTDPSYDRPIIVSVYIGLDGDTNWLPLMQDVDVRKLGDRSGQPIAGCRRAG